MAKKKPNTGGSGASGMVILSNAPGQVIGVGGGGAGGNSLYTVGATGATGPIGHTGLPGGSGYAAAGQARQDPDEFRCAVLCHRIWYWLHEKGKWRSWLLYKLLPEHILSELDTVVHYKHREEKEHGASH